MKHNFSFKGGSYFESGGGGFYHYTEKAFDIIWLSILWILGCLPIITAGASFSALYAASSRSIRGNIGSVMGEYWKSFKRELKQSILVWLIYGGAVTLLLLNMGIIWNTMDGLFRLFMIMLYGVILILVLAAFCYVFPALSRFQMPVSWFVKLSFYMTFRHLPTTIVMVLLFAVGYVVALSAQWTLLILPGVIACAASSMIDPLLEEHEPKE